MSAPLSFYRFAGLLLLTVSLVFATTPPGATRGDEGGAHLLYAPEVAEAPVLDGAGDDAVWAEAETLTTSNEVTLKALRVGDRLYLLAVWADTAPDGDPEGWGFHEDDGEWDRGQDEGEDILAFMWNMGDSIPNFNTQGPYALCMDGTMRTDGDDEVGDLWMWHAGNTNRAGYAHDRYLTNDQGPRGGGGHDGDGEEGEHAPSFNDDTSEHGGIEPNEQELNFTDDDANSTHVPRYWKPDPGSDPFGWHITEDDIDSGAAREIVAVATNGTLTDEDNTTVPSDARIPGSIQELPEGSGGDISARGAHASGQWTLELSRALTTSTPGEDIQFDDETAGTYYFGIAKFDDAHGASHVPSNEAYGLTFAEPEEPEEKDTPAVGLTAGLAVLGLAALVMGRRRRG